MSFQEEEKTPGKYIHSEKAMWGNREKAAICEPRREALGETKPADSLSLDFQPPELWKKYVCCLSHPVCSISLWRPEFANTLTMCQKLVWREPVIITDNL